MASSLETEGATAVLVDFVDVFQRLIDGLPEQIALVDENWVILAVNEAWTKTASLYGYDALQPGTSYVDFCQARADEGHGAARPSVEGIREIDAGLRDNFRYLYHGNDRWEGFTFQLAINRISIGGSTFATITRYDVSELARLRRLREDFSYSLVEAQSEERRCMAREIHDSTQQLLACLGLALGQLKRASDDQQRMTVAAEMEGLLTEVQDEIRSISYLAHPPAVDRQGLPGAIQALAEGFGRRTGLSINFAAEGGLDTLWHPAEVAIYRIVQEALSNTYRHAQACNVLVKLRGTASMVHVLVADDGIGIPDFAREGVGLTGMRARSVEVGGRLTVQRGLGTTIIASLPRQAPLRAVGDLAVRS